MTTITKTNGLILMLNTNKCAAMFNKVHERLYEIFKNTEQCIGLLYADYNTDMNIVNNWKNLHDNMKIFYISPKKNTVALDDKKTFCERTHNLDFVPQYIKNIMHDNTLNDTDLLYIKNRGSSGSVDVRLLFKAELVKETINNNYIIQRDISDQHLINNKRYKLRIYVLLFNKKMYLYNSYFGLLSSKEYDPTEKSADNIKRMNIIHQEKDTIFLSPTEIPDNEKIFEKVSVSCVKLKDVFKPEIESICNNEYTMLGMDYVVDNDRNPYLIEINHRSNYHNVERLYNIADVPAFTDAYKLMITNSIEDTDYICIE